MNVMVDFHGVDERDVVWTPVDELTPSGLPIDRGTEVTLDDGEGHTAQGIVLHASGGLAEVLVNWSTWRDHELLKLIPRIYRGPGGAPDLTHPQEVRTMAASPH